MDTIEIAERVTAVRASRERDHFKYMEYEGFKDDRILRDELTDQSERLAMPMDHSIVFTLDADGRLVSTHGDRLYDIQQNAYEQAVEAAKTQPDIAFEVERRHIELDKLAMVEGLRDGEILIEFSPVPDAVRNGETTINAYDRKRLKMMVRVAEREADKTAINYFSLDLSDYAAMQAAARSVGMEIPDGLGSEDVLRLGHVMPAGHDFSAHDAKDLIITAYDLSLSRRFDGEWRAGREKDEEQRNALEFITSHPDLIEAHLEACKKIASQALDTHGKEELLKKARYNFAAALDARKDGVVFDSLKDAGDAAEAAGMTFEGDCPTFSTAEQQVSAMNGRNEKKWMSCPFCRKRTYSDVCDAVCNECGSTAKGGKSKKLIAQENGSSNEPEEQDGQALTFAGVIEAGIRRWRETSARYEQERLARIAAEREAVERAMEQSAA